MEHLVLLEVFFSLNHTLIRYETKSNFAISCGGEYPLRISNREMGILCPYSIRCGSHYIVLQYTLHFIWGVNPTSRGNRLWRKKRINPKQMKLSEERVSQKIQKQWTAKKKKKKI